VLGIQRVLRAAGYTSEIYVETADPRLEDLTIDYREMVGNVEPDDILELADSFLAEIGETVGKPAEGIAPDAKEQLLAYRWPGNVRELRNAIERAVILADGGFIRSEHLPVSSQRQAASGATTASDLLPPGGVNLDEIERSLVIKALSQARHNKTRAAKLLGLTRAQLYSRIEKYGLQETEA
jgi:DNA-binding NtrC family response regulator